MSKKLAENWDYWEKNDLLGELMTIDTRAWEILEELQEIEELEERARQLIAEVERKSALGEIE